MKPARFFFFPIILLISVLFVSNNSCSKEEDSNTTTNTVPLLTTKDASDITNSSAAVGGDVTNNGGASITERGVCFSTSSNPTIADNSVQSGSGTGAFECEINGLNQNTTYYHKAYAKNSMGTGYGGEKTFTTLGGGGDLPTVTTASIGNITQNSATSGGNVTDKGSSSVTVRGVCWSTSSNPTTSDSHTTDGTGTGSFTSSITGLSASTFYNVRAYATNSSGTVYGNQQSFTTAGSGGTGCQGITTITDPRDGQVYPIVQIENQCWLQKNMNYQTGNSWCYDDNTSNCSTYGRLYDWQTVLGACPSGWHLPSDDEWTVLITFLGGTSKAGGKMKEVGLAHWASPNTGATNSSGFTALPAGGRDANGIFSYLTNETSFWSSTENSSTEAFGRDLRYYNENANRTTNFKTEGSSARCIKD